MITIPVDSEIKLRQPMECDAEELFRQVDANRLYLRQWLPWLDLNLSAADSLRFIKDTRDDFLISQAIVFIILNKREIIGVIELQNIDPVNRKASIGYWLAARYAGKGIMPKVCNKIIAWCFEELLLNRVEIKVACDNKRSEAIPLKLGFHYEGILRQGEWLYDHFVDLKLYSLLQSEYPISK